MIKVYGLKVSYFTGKLESYLRYKEIPYEYVPLTAHLFTKTVKAKTGAMQMPAVELPDGRWMTDTSPMIDWFEGEYKDHPILPEDPLQAFICRLIEDYADEWLWRPAMHYRWSYPTSSKHLRREIANEMAVDVKLPRWLIHRRIEHRQHHYFVVRDGVNERTWDHVERGYLHLLKLLSTIFENRPFLLGDRPTLADIGLMGPMLRHFGMDPVPAKIMREDYPAVMEWLYRTWNAKASRVNGELVDGLPDDLLPLLEEIGGTHLENLCANQEAFAAGKKTYAVTLQGTHYTDVPTSPYRVWCLENLQNAFRALPDQVSEQARTLLQAHGCYEPLMRVAHPNSGYDQEKTVPFGQNSIAVYNHL